MKRVPFAVWVVRKLRGTQETGIAQGPEGICKLGHRKYIGGLWEQIGRLQFEFLVSEGLHPHHYLLDVACGPLRGGVHFIPYLEKGHYLGIDKEAELIRAGIDKELGSELYEMKMPRLVVSSSFEFDKFDVRPDYALAQSLFTHLPAPLIDTCFKKLRDFIRDEGVFYSTFFEVETEISNPVEPDDHGYFAYTREEMERFGKKNGWTPNYIGNWNHPRGQMMVQFCPA